MHPNPFPYADFVTFTTHKTLRGPRGGVILCKEKYINQINRSVFPGIQGGPIVNIIYAKVIAFEEASTKQFYSYQKKVVENSSKMASIFINNKKIIVSGKTENHQFTLNVIKSYKITGKQAEKYLEDVGIIVNKNTIPFDTQSPFVTSGIRIGTPLITSRGCSSKIAEKIGEVNS